VLSGIVAATGGDQAARQLVDQLLKEFADTEDWAALTAVLRRVVAGERDPDTLLPGLDPIETTITTRLLDALAGRLELQPPPRTPNPKAADTDDQ
jgi:hypothetical protein